MHGFQHLNSEQRKAACHIAGPLLVLAGAGSGKTRVVTCRIAYLLENGVDPSSILALTFTNKAAEEMRHRVEKITRQSVWISTFHSLGARILRESISALEYGLDFTIYDADDAEKVLKSVLHSLNLRDKIYSPKVFAHLISSAKNQMQMPQDISRLPTSSPLEEAFPEVYRLYQRRLKEANAVDFDDLLFLTAHLFATKREVLEKYQKRWSYLLIDEYQDTNHAQYVLARLLVEKTHNIFVVGDPDQSIYSWRGACIRNILDFQSDYPGSTVIRLEQNYRSRCNILAAAGALIEKNEQRLEKKLWSDRGEGEKIFLYVAQDERNESEFIAQQIADLRAKGTSWKEMVVFYRTNFQSRALEDALLRRDIPYKIVGGLSFYGRKEIKDILAYLRLVHSKNDWVSFMRCIHIPKRGIGALSLDKITQGASHSNLSLLDFVREVAEGRGGLKLGAKQRAGLLEFLDLIHRLRLVHERGSVRDLVVETISQTGYVGFLRQDAETYEERLENVQELIVKASEWERLTENPHLELFLQELSLRPDAESGKIEEGVRLMTVHNGKGLEFEVAFLAGMEEDLFPHVNCRGSPQAIEEERRLAYVGMTRAKERLYLTCARNRPLWGTFRSMRPSRFLSEIPKHYLQRVF